MTGTKLRYEDVAEIIQIIDASTCEEVVIETSELKLIVRRRGAGAAGAPPNAAPAAASPSQSSASNAAGIAAHGPAPPGNTPAAVGSGLEVRAPMVGTFYRAPAPDKPPFVEVGSVVRKGDPLCLIEVMKLFTTIFAEAEGRVAHIGVDNAAPVEYGQLLFVLEPSLQS